MNNNADLGSELTKIADAITRLALSVDLYRHRFFNQLSVDQRNQLLDQFGTLNQIAGAVRALGFVEGLDPGGVLFAKVRAVTDDLDKALDDLDATVKGVEKALAFINAAINVTGTLATATDAVAIIKAVNSARATLAGT